MRLQSKKLIAVLCALAMIISVFPVQADAAAKPKFVKNFGKIEAVGPHDELYTSCPKYRRMVDLQRLEDEAGGDDNA